MKPATTLLTYADERYRKGQMQLCRSARAVGFGKVLAVSPAHLARTQFVAKHRAILSQPRGAGYWLWKPFLIRRALERLGPNEVLFYCDASIDGFYRFDRFPTKLVELVQAHPQGILIGPAVHQHGAGTQWTKRDAMVLLDADRPNIVSRPQLQAGVSLWRHTPEAIRFVDLWLAACCDPRILTDCPNTQGKPNYPDFIDHRHDQSALTLLAYREKVPFLELTATGIFRVMSRLPDAMMTHRFLKAPRNLERLLRGEPAGLAYGQEALEQLSIRLRRCEPSRRGPGQPSGQWTVSNSLMADRHV